MVVWVGILFFSSPVEKEVFAQKSVSELRQFISERGAACRGCIEKEHFVDRAFEVQGFPIKTTPTPSASGAHAGQVKQAARACLCLSVHVCVCVSVCGTKTAFSCLTPCFLPLAPFFSNHLHSLRHPPPLLLAPGARRRHGRGAESI